MISSPRSTWGFFCFLILRNQDENEGEGNIRARHFKQREQTVVSPWDRSTTDIFEKWPGGWHGECRQCLWWFHSFALRPGLCWACWAFGKPLVLLWIRWGAAVGYLAKQWLDATDMLKGSCWILCGLCGNKNGSRDHWLL